MTTNNKVITFVFREEKKVCKFPNDFLSLKTYFKNVFGLENIENYSFFYINQNIQEVEIKDDQSFNEFLDNSSNLNNEIFIKEKKINFLDKVEETIIFNNINEEPQLSLIDNNNKNNNNNAEESNISLGTKIYNGEKSENSTFFIKGDSLLKKLESNEKVHLLNLLYKIVLFYG